MRAGTTEPCALAEACGDNNPEVVETLLKARASPAAKWKDHCALEWAVAGNSCACAELLLGAKANVDTSSRWPSQDCVDLLMTPLMLACREGHAECAEALLRHSRGGKIFVRLPVQPDTAGNPITPLMLACVHGRPACVRLLLTAGCPTDTAISRGPETMHGDDALFMTLKRSVGCVPAAFLSRAPHSPELAARTKECALLLLEDARSKDPASFSRSILSTTWAVVVFTQAAWLGRHDHGAEASLGMLRTLVQAKVDLNVRADAGAVPRQPSVSALEQYAQPAGLVWPPRTPRPSIPSLEKAACVTPRTPRPCARVAARAPSARIRT